MSTSRHWPALDGLRGIAILLVIPHNADAFNRALPWEWLPAVVSHIGWIGVQIFFVLSGFLITMQLLDSVGSVTYFRSFYVRRVLRIFPLYYLALIAMIFAAPHLVQLPPQARASLSQQTWLWLFLNNWTQPFHGTVYLLSHFWSLAVEEQFYLVWPFVVAACATGRRLIAVCIVVTLLALGAREATALLHLPQDTTYMFTICRMDALAIGALAAAIFREYESTLRQPGAFGRLWWTIPAMVCIALFTHTLDVHNVATRLFGYPLHALIAAVVILASLEKRSHVFPEVLRKLLSLAPLRSVGRYSYAMYVVHLPLLILAGPKIHDVLDSIGLRGPFWYVGTLVLLAYAAGVASYFLFERHFLALKNRFAPRRDEVHVATT